MKNEVQGLFWASVRRKYFLMYADSDKFKFGWLLRLKTIRIIARQAAYVQFLVSFYWGFIAILREKAAIRLKNRVLAWRRGYCT